MTGSTGEDYEMKERKMITILGPTASGKTAVAVALARMVDAEIISADSRQVYRRMDIGTGKDLTDYTSGGAPVRYHLIDIAEPGTKYNLFQYQQDFHQAYADIRHRGHNVILCGGTGLYLEAVLKGYALSPVPQNETLRAELSSKGMDELVAILSDLKARNGSKMHNQTDVDTQQRAIRAIEIEQYNLDTRLQRRVFPAVGSVVIGLMIDREERRRKITVRLRERLAAGMADEIRRLLAEGVSAQDLMYYGLEYKFVTRYVIGELSYDEMFEGLEIAIHQFAKRQMTWFRGMERRGTEIHWIDASQSMDEKVRSIMDIL